MKTIFNNIFFFVQNSFDSMNLYDNNSTLSPYYLIKQNLYEENEERAFKFSSSNLLNDSIIDFDINELFCVNEKKFQKDIITYKFTKICKWEDIKNYISKDNGFSEDIINIVNEYDLPSQYYESLGIFYLNKKRERNDETFNISTTKISKPKGRIKNDDKNNGKSGKHTKDDSDNIIKKCKRILISYLITHINNYINKDKNYEPLLGLKYSYINNLKKDSDLELLQTKLKDIASKEISEKYKTKNKNWNKDIIDKIMNNKIKNENLINLLNMTFTEWIDIFTYKKESKYNKELNLLQSALEIINKKNNQNKKYLSKFIFYLYNYKRWFESKKGRSTSEKNESKKNEENLA